jgi:ABC-type transporter Mla maintaining outer membrane lipid asymmetry ATPase subunit MlaF
VIAAGEAAAIRASDNPVIRQFFSRSADGPIQVV